MNVLPRNDLPLIDFARVHGSIWKDVAEQIGLTTDQAEALIAREAKARAAYEAAESARLAAKAATTNLRAELQGLRREAAALVRFIKAFAESQRDVQPGTIYGLAQIEVPRQPGRARAEAPGTPRGIEIRLNPLGGVTLSWTATSAGRASGGAFIVTRRQVVSAGGATRTLETHATVPGTSRAGLRVSYTDATVPASALVDGLLSYIITPVRGAVKGTPSVAITVRLGVESGGVEAGVAGSVGGGNARRAA